MMSWHLPTCVTGAIIACGGIEAIVCCMKNHSTQSGHALYTVQPTSFHWACSLFCALLTSECGCEEKETVRSLITIAHGREVVPTIIEVMKQHPNDEFVAGDACMALHQLAKNKDNHGDIARVGGAEMFTSVLKQYIGNANVAEHACATLRLLAVDADSNNEQYQGRRNRRDCSSAEGAFGEECHCGCTSIAGTAGDQCTFRRPRSHLITQTDCIFANIHS